MEIANGIRTLYLSGKNQGRRFVSKKSVGVVRFWRSLNFAQRCYFSATLLFALWMYFDINSVPYELLMFSFVLVGVVKETWPKFMTAWNSLPGKAFILFIYAAIANFALASASGMVNDVTGVSASSLPYSHNYALILMLPSWFFFTSALLLFSAIIFMPAYLLLLLLLKPIGIKRVWHPPEYRFVFTTALVRYILTWGMFIKLLAVALHLGLLDSSENVEGDVLSINYAAGEFTKELLESENAELQAMKKASDANGPLNVDANGSLDGNENNPRSAAEIAAASAKAEQAIDRLNTQSKGLNDEIDELIQDSAEKSRSFKRLQRRLLASFVYNFEADSRSRCAFQADSKVIELNDYEILQITQNTDEANEVGFDYEVIACESAAIGQGKNG